MTAERLARIRERLQQSLDPSSLEIVDESHRHVGHVGARDGRGHFRIQIVSTHFQAQPMLHRHRMVYDALQEMLSTDIHALSIEALAPEEKEPLE